MENDLNAIATKLDKLFEQQELILKALQNKIVLDSGRRPLSKKDRKSKLNIELQNQIREMFALRPHKLRLQKEFNLKAQPHASRVKAYLKTNDPSEFDGLKRNRE